MAEFRTPLGHALLLPEGDFSVGADSSNAIPVSAALGLAPVHFRLQRWEGGHFLEDAGSGLGTLVNGQPVNWKPLIHGDVITAGDLEVVYTRHRDGPPTAPSVLAPGLLPEPPPRPVFAAFAPGNHAEPEFQLPPPPESGARAQFVAEAEKVLRNSSGSASQPSPLSIGDQSLTKDFPQSAQQHFFIRSISDSPVIPDHPMLPAVPGLYRPAADQEPPPWLPEDLLPDSWQPYRTEAKSPAILHAPALLAGSASSAAPQERPGPKSVLLMQSALRTRASAWEKPRTWLSTAAAVVLLAWAGHALWQRSNPVRDMPSSGLNGGIAPESAGSPRPASFKSAAPGPDAAPLLNPAPGFRRENSATPNAGTLSSAR